VLNINNILFYKWEYKPKSEMCAWFKNAGFQAFSPRLGYEQILIISYPNFRNVIPFRWNALQLELIKAYAAMKLESIWNVMLIPICPIPTKIDWMA